MSAVPKMSFVMPLRNRTTFTANALPTVLLHAERDHEVILVLDKCPLEHEARRRPGALGDPTLWNKVIREDREGHDHMCRWIDDHKTLLDEYKVRVLEFSGDESFWTGGLRMSGALNMGVLASTTDWIVGVGDEDLVFMQGWDRVMWNTMGIAEGRDPNKVVSNMVMVTFQGREGWDGNRGPVGGKVPTTAWIHAQRAMCTHYLTFPLALEHQDPRYTRVSYAAFERFCNVAKLPGVVEERCGVRNRTHWVPELMYKPMLVRHGVWPTHDAAAFGPDITQDDLFHAAGIQRRMASDHFVLHSKHYIYINDDVDRVWVDPKIREIVSVLQ